MWQVLKYDEASRTALPNHGAGQPRTQKASWQPEFLQDAGLLRKPRLLFLECDPSA